MNRGLLIALVSAVLILAVGVAGIAAYVFLWMPQGGPPAAASAPPASEVATDAAFLKMDKFVTNLGDTDRLRYIDFSIALGLKSTDSEAKVKEAVIPVRDKILTQVRELKAADLAGANGKAKLAEVINKGLTELLPGHVTQVYVTDMVIQ